MERELEVEYVNKDGRGEVLRILFRGDEFLLVTQKKGVARGGHSHKLDVKHFFISGSLVYKSIENGKEIEKVVKAGDVLHVKSGIIHMLTALEDSIFLEEVPKGQETTNYEPWRKIVEKFI